MAITAIGKIMSLVNLEKERERKSRIDIRLPLFQKNLIEEAAALKGVSTTVFLLDSVIKAAQEELDRNLIIKISLENQKKFLDSLAYDDFQANSALANAVERHKGRKNKK